MTLIFCLKNANANINVNIGVREFRIPLNELLISVCAVTNRKYGKALPKIPTQKNAQRLDGFNAEKCLMVLGNKTKNTKKIRIEAISFGGKTSNPRFIKMNELPQMSDKKPNVAAWTDLELKSIFCIGAKVNSNPF